jgi:hypothetical protein
MASSWLVWQRLLRTYTKPRHATRHGMLSAVYPLAECRRASSRFVAGGVLFLQSIRYELLKEGFWVGRNNRQAVNRPEGLFRTELERSNVIILQAECKGPHLLA